MTVYSGVISRYHVASVNPHTKRALVKFGGETACVRFGVGVKIGHIPVFKLNLVLILAAAVIVIMYVFMSNLLVSQRYILGMRKSELNQLNAKLLTEKQYGTNQDLRALLLFAQKSGLVEAKDTDSILENDGFAIFSQ